MDAADVRRIIQRHSAAKASLQCLIDEHAFVEIGKDLGDRRACGVARDTEQFDLAKHAGTTAMLQADFRAGAGERGAVIVQRALLPQSRDRCLDLVEVEFAPDEPLSQLSFR